jgi:hypothetical protein
MTSETFAPKGAGHFLSFDCLTDEGTRRLNRFSFFPLAAPQRAALPNNGAAASAANRRSGRGRSYLPPSTLYVGVRFSKTTHKVTRITPPITKPQVTNQALDTRQVPNPYRFEHPHNRPVERGGVGGLGHPYLGLPCRVLHTRQGSATPRPCGAGTAESRAPGPVPLCPVRYPLPCATPVPPVLYPRVRVPPGTGMPPPCTTYPPPVRGYLCHPLCRVRGWYWSKYL